MIISVQLIENLIRQDLDPGDQAQACLDYSREKLGGQMLAIVHDRYAGHVLERGPAVALFQNIHPGFSAKRRPEWRMDSLISSTRRAAQALAWLLVTMGVEAHPGTEVFDAFIKWYVCGDILISVFCSEQQASP